MDWKVRDLELLERELDRLVMAFPDPSVEGRSPRRMLAVGHTQSGKTANFLGLAARMADAGVKLVVVLSGRTKILRRQTQARVDRDLIGRDARSLTVLEEEYPKGHGLLERLSPPSHHAPEESWTRLTRVRYSLGARGTGDDDAFQRPASGLRALDLSHPIVAVLKKTPDDLAAFRAALASATPTFRRLPAIVIDEEADEASLNYKQKRAPGGGWAPVMSDEEMSSIHGSILEILVALERSVYMGYTATPFASCFADPGEENGLFPHVIQVLDPPAGYFGASHVFDSLYTGPVGGVKPSTAHTRPIPGPANLPELDDALDDFLIAGAIKSYRQGLAERIGDGQALRRLRHHTMMVHTATGRLAQRALRDEVHARLFSAAGRGIEVLSPASTARRLRSRYETEFRPTSLSMTSEPGRLPTDALGPGWVPDWEELAPHVKEAVVRLVKLNRSEAGVVLLVNSDADRDTPEYDSDASREGRWCVLVGGLMLSRGFTVEGLSTVYFRRTSSAMDTQLQLARWNGYRNYFEDTIRLWFGVAEPGSKRSGPRNLLDEFERSAQRDHQFREQLRRYAEEGTSPRRDLPRFFEARGQSALPPTQPAKRRGLVRSSGAPIELGRRGGLKSGHRSIAVFARHAALTGDYASTPVCANCDTGPSRRMIRVLRSEVKADSVRDFVQAFLASSSSSSVLAPEDQTAMDKALKKPAWGVALIGVADPNPPKTARFGSNDVPVRLRSDVQYGTLSTGEWNDWMRIAVGGSCPLCGSRSTAAPQSIVVPIPFVRSERDKPEDAMWGVLIQLIGRAGPVSLVTRPSRRP